MATKNIEPNLRLISEYTKLGKDDKFRIPEYQRGYSWTTMHCDKLWQDIESFIESEAEDPYFFGTIIIDCSTDNCLNLIDGQQRTTTFLLLLKALQLRLKEVLENLQISPDTKALNKGLSNSYDTIFEILFKADDDKQVAIQDGAKPRALLSWRINPSTNSIRMISKASSRLKPTLKPRKPSIRYPESRKTISTPTSSVTSNTSMRSYWCTPSQI